MSGSAAPTGIVLQARMGSTRLPGKVLRPLCGVPMIERIVERLRRCRNAPLLIVATTEKAEDDVVAETAGRLGVDCFRGSETDVLDRYYQAARRYRLGRVVRATGDNPFVDAEETDRLLDLQRQTAVDYASAFPEFGSGLPVGIGTEVFTFTALERTWAAATTSFDREHVNEYIYAHPERFSQSVLLAPAEKRCPGLRLTVDTPDEFAAAESLQREFMEQSNGDPLVPTAWLIAHAHSDRRTG